MAEVISLLILFLILLPKLKVSINNANSLTADFSTNVKGFLCILIFYNHMAGWFETQGLIFQLFSHMGSFVVGVFFFLSAFGLTKAYPGELSFSFLIKRFIKILVPYWICEIIYIVGSVVCNIALQVDVTWKNIFLSAIQLRTIVENSWYVGAILLLYVIFYICKKVLPKIDLTLKTTLLMIIASFIFKGYWTTFFAFPLGIFIGEREQRILNLGKGKRFSFFIVSFMLCSLAIGLKFYGNSIGNEMYMNISDMLTSVLFASAVFFILTFVKIGNRILKFLGNISYEIYLLHGLALRVAYKYVGLKYSVLFFIVAFAVTILLSFLTNRVSSVIIKPILKQMKSKEKNNEIYNIAH